MKSLQHIERIFLIRKRITAFVFLLIVLMPVFLLCKFLAEEAILQHEMKEKLNAEDLQVVYIAKSEISRVSERKEIMIGGKLFDVKSIELKGDIAKLTGLYDLKETKLEEEFKNIVQNTDGNSPFDQFAFKFLFFPGYSCPVQITVETNWKIISNEYHRFNELIPSLISHRLIHPPQV